MQESSSRTRWTGWVMIFGGSLLCAGFVFFKTVLGAQGVELRPAWAGDIPIVLSLIVVVSGVTLVWRAKKDAEVSHE